jgi:FxsC-like protein
VKPRAKLGSTLTPEQVGFIDRSGIDVGDEWPRELRNGLLASRVMVVLLSRSYLASEFCGKELEVFRRRLDRYMQAPPPGAVPPPLVLPVLWDWPKRIPPLPDVLKRVQYDHSALGDAYEDKGLRTLASQTRLADDYREFVDMFAERLVEVAEPNALPQVDIPAVDELPSAFGSRAVRQAAPLPAGAGSDSDIASLVFLVGTAAELSAVRTDVTAYAADQGWRWRPFQPEVDKPVHVLALQAAAKEELFPERMLVDDQLLDRLREAEDRQSMVLLIVDPWSARLDPYKRCLDGYDERRMINAEVLVLSSASDEETAAQRDRLRDDLRRTVYRTFTLNSTSLRESITSADAFEQQVIAAINEIRKRLMQVGRLRPVRGTETSGSLPLLSGPGGA